MKKILLRGSLLGCFGSFFIIAGGTLLPMNQLEFWGLPILLSGLFLIALGLIPHRKLVKLEQNPSKLDCDGEMIQFSPSGKSPFQIPYFAIEKIDYLENRELYGWGVRLKRPTEGELPKESATFIAQNFEGYDLFLPYFSKRSLKELIDQIPA